MDLLAPEIIIPTLLARQAIKYTLKFEAEVVIGTALYGAGLVTWRMLRGLGNAGRSAYHKTRGIHIELPKKTESVNSVMDINSVYRLKGLEVVLGFDATKRPVRVDLDRYHTLVAGVSGGGKTTLLNMVIGQLVMRPGFREQYDLYLLDLKSSKEDYLRLWKPVIAGYYGIDEKGSSESAIQALNDIAEKMHRDDSGKRILLIVDELAMLTTQSTDNELRKQGHAIMQRLAAQIRDRGAILAATQRPHYEVVSRGVTGQMERKICLRVDDLDTGKMILRFKPTVDVTGLKNGEYVLKEPGARMREQTGRTLLMKLPSEIDQIVARVIEIDATTDDRLRIFQMACAPLNQGDNLPGVNREMWKGQFPVEVLKTAYKNYALAGAVIALVDNKRRQPYKYVLAGDYGDCYKRVVAYIQEGKWQSAPETIGRVNGDIEENE